MLAVAILGLVAIIWMNVDQVAARRMVGLAVATDGDTLRLAGERIRLRGLDAPELDQSCRRAGADYPCGREALRALADIVADTSVTCEGWERDRYGRRLATCRASGRDINRILVEQGWAVAFGDYEDAEAEARQAGRGLWAGDFDMPKAWREQHGGLAEARHDHLGAMLNWLRQLFGFS